MIWWSNSIRMGMKIAIAHLDSLASHNLSQCNDASKILQIAPWCSSIKEWRILSMRPLITATIKMACSTAQTTHLKQPVLLAPYLRALMCIKTTASSYNPTSPTLNNSLVRLVRKILSSFNNARKVNNLSWVKFLSPITTLVWINLEPLSMLQWSLSRVSSNKNRWYQESEEDLKQFRALWEEEVVSLKVNAKQTNSQRETLSTAVEYSES